MKSVSTVASPPPAATTLESWSAEWLGFSVHLKPTTLVSYESLLRTRILPTFGALSLTAIEGLGSAAGWQRCTPKPSAHRESTRATAFSVRSWLQRSTAVCSRGTRAEV